MDEKFRLVFRGELLDGQHRAVVKRRLTDRLKLSADQADKLFSGEPVVVKRDADRSAATRYQSVFKQAGGLLRVQPVSQTPVADPPASKGDPIASAQLRAIRPAANPDVAAPDFTVLTSYVAPPRAPVAAIESPRFEVAEVGTRLVEPAEVPTTTVADVHFELAERGAALADPREPRVVALGPLDFELAEVGADLGPDAKATTVAAPDVSHLALVER